MRPPSEPARSSRWWIVLAGVLVVAAGTYFVSSRARNAPLPAVSSIVSALENSRRMADAERVRSACSASAAQSCACRQEAAHRALDKNLHAEAQAVLSGDAECSEQPASRGLIAESLARADRSDDATAKANEVLSKEPTERFATYALAHASFARGDAIKAIELARRAIELGRGAPAHLLLGMIAYRMQDLAGARGEFERMLVDNPEDIDALYNLAVVAGRENRYRDARESYLRVLALDPRHLDARYNLGLLTFQAGASAEAKHHLEQLEAIAPKDDPRVTSLRAALAKAPPPDR